MFPFQSVCCGLHCQHSPLKFIIWIRYYDLIIGKKMFIFVVVDKVLPFYTFGFIVLSFHWCTYMHIYSKMSHPRCVYINNRCRYLIIIINSIFDLYFIIFYWVHLSVHIPNAQYHTPNSSTCVPLLGHTKPIHYNSTSPAPDLLLSFRLLQGFHTESRNIFNDSMLLSHFT